MGKEQAASLYIAPDDCFNIVNGTCQCPGLWRGSILDYPEFRADVGKPEGPMRLVHGNSSGGLWLREYTTATIAVNTLPGVLDGAPPGSGIAVPLAAGKRYTDLWGTAVPGSGLRLGPVGAAVLLKSSAQ